MSVEAEVATGRSPLIADVPAAAVFVALVSALGLRFAVTFHVLPRAATYADIPLVWAAFLAAIVIRRGRAGDAGTLCRWISAFVVAVAVSWIVHPSELLRPLLYVMLVGEPFAAVAAMWIAPASARLHRLVTLGVIGLLAVQLPVAAVQFVVGSGADRVQGTLSGAFAAAHVIGAVAVIGGAWLLLREEGSMPLRLAIGGGLLLIPFASDAKQVLIASPAMVAGVPYREHRRVWFGILVAVVVGAVVALAALPGSGYARVDVADAFSSDGGKVVAARIVLRAMSEDVGSVVFGKGPAETVTRTAFLTAGGYLREDSPLRAIGLETSPITMEVLEATIAVGGEYSSFRSGVSSALGVLGDLGVVGVVVYLGMLWTVFVSVRRLRSRESIAIAGSWAMFFVLGFVFDWWEQPPVGLLLATLSGLALTAGRSSAETPSPPGVD